MAANVKIGKASACWKAERERKLRIRSVLRAMHVECGNARQAVYGCLDVHGCMHVCACVCGDYCECLAVNWEERQIWTPLCTINIQLWSLQQVTPTGIAQLSSTPTPHPHHLPIYPVCLAVKMCIRRTNWINYENHENWVNSFWLNNCLAFVGHRTAAACFFFALQWAAFLRPFGKHCTCYVHHATCCMPHAITMR